MHNSRALFFISVCVALALAYLLILIAYMCSISAQSVNLIADEYQPSVNAINFIATLLALLSIVSLIWHFIHPNRSPPTTLTLSTVLLSTLATIIFISRYLFAS